jgi:hypothetical protein
MPLISAKSLFKDDDIEDDTEDDAVVAPDAERRVFAAKRNQFVVHLFVALDDDVNDVCDDLSRGLSAKFPLLEWTPRADRHLSLIDGLFGLRFHELTAFEDCFRREIQSIRWFRVCLNSVQLFANDDNSRHFLVVAESHATAHPLVEAVRRVCAHFRNNRLVDSPAAEERDFRFHVSLGAAANGETAAAVCPEVTSRLSEPIVARVSRIALKMGNICKELVLK